MNRYRSTTHWRKVTRGEYQSPDGQWLACRGNKKWILHSRLESDTLPYHWLMISSFLTLADCQEWARAADNARAVSKL